MLKLFRIVAQSPVPPSCPGSPSDESQVNDKGSQFFIIKGTRPDGGRVPSNNRGFRRWIIRNFCELKEHILTQCKETKNFKKRIDEILMRIDNLEMNISELVELKNTI
ncbi:hypothetical protein AAY473_012418 [Plecturocebus cupreus]